VHKEWNPLAIYAHQDFPNYLFIKLRSEIVIVSTHSAQPVFISSIPIETAWYQAALTANSLIVINTSEEGIS
jgi:hypothetical protein